MGPMMLGWGSENFDDHQKETMEILYVKHSDLFAKILLLNNSINCECGLKTSNGHQIFTVERNLQVETFQIYLS